jgi:hypothetical protein
VAGFDNTTGARPIFCLSTFIMSRKNATLAEAAAGVGHRALAKETDVHVTAKAKQIMGLTAMKHSFG